MTFLVCNMMLQPCKLLTSPSQRANSFLPGSQKESEHQPVCHTSLLANDVPLTYPVPLRRIFITSLEPSTVTKIHQKLREVSTNTDYTAGLSSRSISSNDRPFVSTTLLFTYATAAAQTAEKKRYTVLTPKRWTTLKNISPMTKLQAQ